MTNVCACIGKQGNDEYCYCELKHRGMDTSHLEPSKEEMESLKEGFAIMFNWNKESENV